jgi:eukaryotic-like serine/threonine-protein kinase
MSRILAGRYEVGDLIGTGGMADVFQGRDSNKNFT